MLRRSLQCFPRRKWLTSVGASLHESDPEIHNLIQSELRRQQEGLELIASENFTSRAVLSCLGSVLTNKYAEGLPGHRYYGGNEVVDEVERLCCRRALSAFRLDPTQWGVNVQPYSGSPANFAAYTALLQPHERIMGLDLPAGGHLTHGYYTAQRRISASSIFFESLPYSVTPDGVVDYDGLRRMAEVYKPKLIIAGGSAYPFDWEYKRYREICDAVGAFLMVDMAHISGLVATQEHNDPFAYADVVTSTTHKTLRGPRSGIIFFRKQITRGKEVIHIEDRINNAVFPALQGGPHLHQIAAVATQLREANTPLFKEYIIQVKKNAKALAKALMDNGHQLIGNGTENHLILWNLRQHGITGSKIEKLFDAARITVNKNAIIGDKSALTPGGVRLGTAALTTRGLCEKDFAQVAKFLIRGVEIGKRLQEEAPSQKLMEFVDACKNDHDIKHLANEVQSFSHHFPFPTT